jgi:hypothetical protein
LLSRIGTELGLISEIGRRYQIRTFQRELQQRPRWRYNGTAIAMAVVRVDTAINSTSSLMTTSNFVFLILVLAIVSTGAAPAKSNALINNSFESPAVPVAPGYLQLSGGSSAIPGWTVEGDNIILLDTTYSEDGPPFFTGMVQFNAQDGSNSVDLTGGGGTNSSTNGIQQTVATTPGLPYQLQFYVGRAQSNNGDSRYQTPVTVDLSINGSPRVGFINSETVIPQGFVNWKQFTTTFNATGPSTTITFLNGTPFGTNFLGLDNVSLSAVVELPGDYNNNGGVDAADYIVWRSNLGTNNVLPNDPIGGTIGAAQYDQWRSHFGQSAGSGSGTVASAAVPEPAALMLMLFAAVGWCLQRGRNT